MSVWGVAMDQIFLSVSVWYHRLSPLIEHAWRRQLRKEKFDDRKNFYEDLMSEPTTEKFYKLIRRNKGNSRSQVSSLIVDGQEISSPEQQRKSFAQYYEELSVPKNENYVSAFLELCTVRHELITQYCDENPMTLDPITKS